MNTKYVPIIAIFVGILAVGGIFAVSASTASASTLTQTFTQHPQATNVFDFGQPMQNPRITVSYVWCWEDGSTTGCFAGSQNVSVGQTGLIHSNIKDDGGNGATGPYCLGYNGNPGAYDYCMSVYSSSWDGQRLTINWIGITDRYLNNDPLFNKPYMTKIDVTADAPVQSISSPTGFSASCPNPGTQGLLSWNSVSGAVRYGVRIDNLANPWNGYGTPYPGDVVNDNVTGTTFSFSSIPGAQYHAWVHAINSAGTWGDPASVNFSCGTTSTPPPPPPPTPLPTVNLTASTYSIQQSGSVILSWTSQYASSCSSSFGSVGTSGTKTVMPSQTTTYTITCSNSSGFDSDSKTVIVQQTPPPTVSATADLYVIQQGGSSMISWSSAYATSCTNNGNPIALSGSSSVSPSQTSNYTITCSNSAGSGAKVVTITVQQAQQSLPTVSAVANPTVIQQNGSSMISWSSAYATSCTNNGNPIAHSGSSPVSPSVTSTYTIVCSNSVGSDSDTVTITVQQAQQQLPVVSISASPQIVTQGNTAVLYWSSSNAYSCYATGAWSGTKSLSGSETVYLTQTSAYGINCTGTNGSNSSSVTVTVYTNTQTPTVSLSGSPTTVGTGGQAVLVWSSSNANYCAGSGGWSGTKSTSGSQVVYPTSTVTYGLTCYNSQGSSTYDSETITVSGNPSTGIFAAGCAASQSIASVGQSIVFAGGESGGIQPVTYYWSGSITPGGGQTRTITFTTPGLKTVTLTVTDAQGRIATDTCTVQVNSVVVTGTPTPPVVLTTADVCETTCRPQGYIKVTEIPQLVNATNNTQLTPDQQKSSAPSFLAALFGAGSGGLSAFGWLLLFLILASIGFLIYMLFVWRRGREDNSGGDYYNIPPPPRSPMRPAPTRIAPPAPVPPRVPMPPYTSSGSGAPTPPNIPMRPIHNEDAD